MQQESEAMVPFFELELGEWPGGSLSAMECRFPDAPDGGIDLALPVHCEQHMRTIWWCLNAGVLWCDGGAGGGAPWQWHRWYGIS